MGIEDILDAHDPYILKVTPRQLLQFAEAIIEKNTEKIAAILKGENGEKLVSTKKRFGFLVFAAKHYGHGSNQRRSFPSELIGVNIIVWQM